MPWRAGKTTFIKNLLAPYAQDPNMHVNDAPGSEEALELFKSHPERMSTTVLVNDHSSLTSFHYRVQDTPGERRSPIQAVWALEVLSVYRDCTLDLRSAPMYGVKEGTWADCRADFKCL